MTTENIPTPLGRKWPFIELKIPNHREVYYSCWWWCYNWNIFTLDICHTIKVWFLDVKPGFRHSTTKAWEVAIHVCGLQTLAWDYASPQLSHSRKSTWQWLLTHEGGEFEPSICQGIFRLVFWFLDFFLLFLQTFNVLDFGKQQNAVKDCISVEYDNFNILFSGRKSWKKKSKKINF